MLRTLTLRSMSYRRKRSRTDKSLKSLTELPGSTGAKKLDFYDFALKALSNPNIVNQSDARKGRYCRILNVVPDEEHRMIHIEARVGPYGEPGEIIDTTTGSVQEEHDGDKANALTQRAILMVPADRGVTAFLGLENLSGMPNPLGDAIKNIISEEWDKKNGEWMLEIDTVVRGDAWIASADLAEVQLKYNHKRADFADDPTSAREGRMVAVFEPKRGDKFFPKNWFPAISAGNKGLAAAVLGFEDEPDEVLVKLGDGDQQRTFVVGKERTPSVRVLLSDHGEVRPSDLKFKEATVSEVKDIVDRTSADGWNLG